MIKSYDFNNYSLIRGFIKKVRTMGCTNSQVDQEVIRVIHLDYRQVNVYIDKLPLFMIQKIKDKFDQYCNDQAELSLQQFCIMCTPYLKNASSSQEYIRRLTQRLYLFYSDLNQMELRFKNFISKYATINHCDEKIMADIIFFLAGSSLTLEAALTQQECAKFILENSQYFSFTPDPIQSNEVTKVEFKKLLTQTGFLYQEYRKNFSLLDKEDLPFDSISRGLIDMDINDYSIGEEYYVLSSSWFERWSFYYQGIQDESAQIKSTKLLKKKRSIRHNKRPSFTNGGRQVSLDRAGLIIERPNQISFEDIQGQFFKELKQNIRINFDCKIVSKQLWELFKKTMPPEYQLKRIANSTSTLDLYPKNIYFLKTDSNGVIIGKSLKNILIPLKTKLSEIQTKDQRQKKDEKQRHYFFIKNLGDNIWLQEDPDSLLARCSTETRFFVVKTVSKAGFIDKYLRKKKQEANITYGDRVFSYFPFIKKINPAYIMSLPTDQTALIHYCGFNHRYQIQVPLDSLSIEQNELQEQIRSKKKSVRIENCSFKGIKNIGNTCFINSIIQCLIATPVMGAYLNQSTFQKQKQPLLHEISKLTKDLLANRKVSPVELKKVIDVHLDMFSGHDQHDAQEFLSYLLDKFSTQMTAHQKLSQSRKKIEEETIIDHLFAGVVQSTIICQQCRHEKKIDERTSIISLPIPEPEFTIYNIYCFPIYEKTIRRIILRLHRACRLKDYVRSFEDRIGGDVLNYIFLEIQSGITKKIRHDFYETSIKNPLVSETGLSSDNEVHCFEKITDHDLLQIKDENRRKHKHRSSKFFDYHDKDQDKWIFARLIQIQQTKVTLQLMDEDSSMSFLKLKEYPERQIKPLGSEVKEKSYKKLFNRRYNSALQKMESFGFHYMISFPKEASFNQLLSLIQIALKNFVEPGIREIPYTIKINEANKNKCLFCQKVEQKLVEGLKEGKENFKKMTHCCTPTEQQMNLPLIWLARQKIYAIFVDWHNLDGYCTTFAASAEVDSLSKAAERAHDEDKIDVESCLNLLQQPEKVEIQCDKCKHKEAKRFEVLKEVPNILILHMKEFRFTADQVLIKMDANIHWIEYLDISKYSISSNGSIYELFAYVRHTGTSQSGHYTSVVKRKHPFQNKRVWVNFDDDLTNIVQTEQKNIDSAYLLFFKKVDMPNSSYVNFNGMRELQSMTLSKEILK